MGFLFKVRKLRLYYQIQKSNDIHSKFYNPGIEVEAKHTSAVLPMWILKLNEFASFCVHADCNTVVWSVWPERKATFSLRIGSTSMAFISSLRWNPETQNTYAVGGQTKSCNSQFSQWENRKNTQDLLIVTKTIHLCTCLIWAQPLLMHHSLVKYAEKDENEF